MIYIEYRIDITLPFVELVIWNTYYSWIVEWIDNLRINKIQKKDILETIFLIWSTDSQTFYLYHLLVKKIIATTLSQRKYIGTQVGTQ